MRVAAAVVSLGLVVSLATPAAADPPRRKSHETAQFLSGFGAGVSTALIVTSFAFVTSSDPFNKPLFYTGVATSVVSPSLGEFYTGEFLTWGEAVRASAFALAVVGATRTSTTSCISTEVAQCTTLSNTGIALLGLAAIGYVTGVMYDVLDSRDAVDRYNYKLRMQMQITPGVIPSTFGPPGAGVFVTGRW